MPSTQCAFGNVYRSDNSRGTPVHHRNGVNRFKRSTTRYIRLAEGRPDRTRSGGTRPTDIGDRRSTYALEFDVHTWYIESEAIGSPRDTANVRYGCHQSVCRGVDFDPHNCTFGNTDRAIDQRNRGRSQ